MHNHANIFAVERTDRPLGRGWLVTLIDDDVKRFAIEVAGKMTMIRPGAHAALMVLVAKVGEVASLHEFSGLRDSVRRDLGTIRTPLEKCGYNLDVVQGVGYRLALRRARPATKRCYDLRIDADVLRVSCGGKTLTLASPIEMAIVLTLLNGHSHDAGSLYRAAYGDEAMINVADMISRRIGNLRVVLDELGSEVKIIRWMVRGQTRYAIQGPGRSEIISIDGRRYEQTDLLELL